MSDIIKEIRFSILGESLYEKCITNQGVTEKELEERLELLKENGLDFLDVKDMIKFCKMTGEKDWEMLVHVVNFSDLKPIKDSGVLIASEQAINNWLNDKDVQETFGHYFEQDDLRHHLVQELTKNSNNLVQLKKKKLNDLQPVGESKVNITREFNHLPGVYTHYLFRDLLYKDYCWSFDCFFNEIVFGISSKVLQDLPWIACDRMNYGLCTIEYGEKGYITPNWYYSGKGKKTNMEPIREHINKDIFRRGDGFVNSHEIIFDSIPVKYLSVIFCTQNNVELVKEIFPDIPIQVVKARTKRENFREVVKPYI